MADKPYEKKRAFPRSTTQIQTGIHRDPRVVPFDPARDLQEWSNVQMVVRVFGRQSSVGIVAPSQLPARTDLKHLGR